MTRYASPGRRSGVDELTTRPMTAEDAGRFASAFSAIVDLQ